MSDQGKTLTENSINRDALESELSTIQSKTIDDFALQLDARLSFIEKELKKPDITPEEKRFYEQYIQAVSDLETRYDWTETTKNSLKSLLQQIQTSQNKSFLTALKEKIETIPVNIEVAHFISVTNWANNHVVEEIKKNPEKASLYKGTAGWLIIARLEESGMYPRIVTESTGGNIKKQIIRIDTKNGVDQSKALALSNALNTQFSDIRDGLEYALMWNTSQFGNFSQSTLDSDGKVNPKAELSYEKYVKDAQKKGLMKSDADRAFLDSLAQMPAASNPESMKKAITGYIQFQESMVGIKKKLQENPKAQEELEKAAKAGQEKSATSSGIATDGTQRMTAKLTSEVDGSTGQSIGNFVGKAARGSVNGLFGGMGDFLKMGGGDPIATLVIGGGLLYGIYKTFKEFGFFGGIGALLGIGAVNNAEAIFGKDKDSKGTDEKPGDTPSTPATPRSSNNTPNTSSNSGNETTPQNNLTPEQAFHTSLLTLPANTAPEKLAEKMNPINTLAHVPFSLLQNALKQKGGTDAHQKAWDAVRSSVNYDSMSVAEKKKFDTTITEQQNIDTINQYVINLSQKDEAQKALIQLPNITLENLSNAVRREEENKESLQPSPELAKKMVDEVTILNESYGPMIALARMIEYGYLPKVNFSLAEVASKEGWMPRLLKAPIWVTLGTGLTAQNPKETVLTGKWHKEAEETLAKWSKMAVNEEKILLKKLQKENTGVDIKNKSIIDNQNIVARSQKIQEIEKVLETESFDKNHLTALMSEYSKFTGTPLSGKETSKITKAERRAEIEKVKELNRINTEIEKLQKEITDALEKANKDPTPENIKAAQDLTAKKNALIVELEGKGVQNLSKMNISQIEALTHTNPWVAKMVTVNGGIDKANEWLGKHAGSKTGRTILGVGIIALVWNSKGSISEMWQKGDWTNLAKAGWDFGAGMVPILSTVHESAILSNSNGFGLFGTGYRDFILGKGYEMGKLETGFRAIGMVPLAGFGTKVAGRATIAIGEKVASATTIAAGKGLIESSIAGIKLVQTGAQLGTYGVLGYSATTGVYDLAFKK